MGVGDETRKVAGAGGTDHRGSRKLRGEASVRHTDIVKGELMVLEGEPVFAREVGRKHDLGGADSHLPQRRVVWMWFGAFPVRLG